MQQRKLIFFSLFLLLFSVLSFRLKMYLFPSQDLFQAFTTTLIFGAVFGTFLWVESLSRIYHLYLRFTRKEATKHLLWAVLAETLATLIFFYGFKAVVDFQPAVLLVDPVIFLGAYLLLYYWVSHLSYSGFFSGNILWISKPENFTRSKEWIQDHHNKKVIIDLDSSNLTAERLEAIIVERRINEIVLVRPDMNHDAFESMANFLVKKSIGFFVIKDYSFWKSTKGFNLDRLERGYTNRDSLLNMSLKRLFDLAVSIVLLAALFPVFALIGLLIKLDDGGPIFYVSSRIGKNGRKIRFIKFRSMVRNAESLKANLAQQNDRGDGPLFKMRNDPRITSIGKILRKYSLDELPQFINVFRGELSLVGPRPHLESEAACYEGFEYQRMDCVPGITCLAQIKDRNRASFREWIELDIKYRNEWSFALDFWIIGQTVKVVFQPIVQTLKGHKVDVY